jgi:hypothetical protein
MMKRLSLLLAALFVASMVLVAPVFASGNHENNNGGDNEKVCVLHKDNGEHKDYRWVSKDDTHNGDKVVKDKFCEHRNNGEHKDNNGEHKDNNGEHKDNGDNNNDNGHANNNNDDNGHANNDDDWS